MSKKLKSEEERIVENYNKIKSSFTDQYVISNFLPEIIKQIETEKLFDNTSKHIIPLRKLDPFLLNTLVNSQGANPKLRSVFNTFNNAQLTSLVPEIRILIRTRTGKDKYELVPIPIQNLQPKLEILKSPEITGATLGLKEVNFEFGGTSPETARNDINASAVFFGNSLAVFQEHKEYVDLIVPHFKQSNGVSSEVLFQVGWSIIEDPTNALKFTKEQKEAVKIQFQTFVMSYTSHSFNFNQDGSFVLQVEYVSYIDGVLRDANFLGDKEVINDVYDQNAPKPSKIESSEREQIIGYIKENHQGATDEFKKVIYNNIARGNITQNINKFKERLEARAAEKFADLFDGIDYNEYQVPLRQMNSVILRRSITRVSPGGSAMKDKVAQTLYQTSLGSNNLNLLDFFSQEETKKIKDTKRNDDSSFIGAFQNLETVTAAPLKFNETIPLTSEKAIKRIKVTSLGKIIESFIEKSTGVKELMSQNHTTLVLGTIKLSDSSQENGKIHSLYDLPVAEQTIKRVVRKYYTSKIKTKVTLRGFLSYLFAEIRENYLQGDLVLDSGKKLHANTLRSIQMTCSRKTRSKIKRTSGRALTQGIRGDLRSLDASKIANLYFVTAGPASDDPDFDLDTYVVGAANSVIKGVNFTQANTATMQARRDENIVAAFRNSSELGVLPQLYNVSIDMVGNLNFLPGYLFNLTPTVLGISNATKDSILKDLGLMGSYMTLKVEHSFGSNGFKTSLNAYNIATQKYIDKVLVTKVDK